MSAQRLSAYLPHHWFFYISNFHCSCMRKCCSFYFQGGLEKIFRKKSFFFGSSGFSSNIVGLVVPSLIFLVLKTTFIVSCKCKCYPLFIKEGLQTFFNNFFLAQLVSVQRFRLCFFS